MAGVISPMLCKAPWEKDEYGQRIHLTFKLDYPFPPVEEGHYIHLIRDGGGQFHLKWSKDIESHGKLVPFPEINEVFDVLREHYDNNGG